MTETPEPSPAAAMPATETSTKPRRVRRGRKRMHFKAVARVAQPVRALWDQASEEERQRAHATCGAMIEYWLGKVTREEVATRLQVTPLRVWQLSQQAVSGMTAGLLKQPRPRAVAAEVTARDPAQDPRMLKRRVAELERELKLAQDVVKLLRDLPGNREPGRERPARTDGASTGAAVRTADSEPGEVPAAAKRGRRRRGAADGSPARATPARDGREVAARPESHP